MKNSQLQAQKLYEVALEGDVQSLLNLLQEDPLILDRYNIVENSGQFTQSPLHVAVSLGHLEFTKEILCRKPELTEELDQIRRWSPLHVASGKGYLEIVKALTSVNRNMCLAPDIDGYNPVHVAAVRGHVHVIDDLLKVVPQAARERIKDCSSVLHLCVKHCQVDALVFLINVVDDVELLNFRDADGNTVLHLAVANKNTQMVKFLLKNKKMEKNAINKNGMTAMDIHIQSKKGINDSEIRVPLKRAKALKAKAALKPRNKNKTWLENQRSALMVVASLIATMAFQVGISPPGGVWQDNDGHNAGNSVMADVVKDDYDQLLIYNTAGLISSLSVILLLISGLPFRRLFVAILMITMWIAVTATTLSYIVSVNYLAGNRELLTLSSKNHRPVLYSLGAGIGVWLILMVLLLLGHAVRFVVKLIRGFVRLLMRLCKR
ncbi:uncharacterized protein LOC141621126 [Silene latifolia]|uniref:uncharacterized protein LOC141621126 n=1 Tax=Silene latifolia TaxID=37657 RepID=UPI003D776B21